MGISAGTAGNVNCSKVTKPEAEHVTPDQVQTLKSLPHPPFESAVCPVVLVDSRIARSPQNWTAFVALELLVTLDKTGRQVEQG